MKILIVTPYFYPKIGGVENYVYYSALSFLANTQHEVVIVAANHEGNINKLEKINGIKVYRLAKLLKISNTPINPLWLWELNNLVAKEKPDVISAHTPVPFMADLASLVATWQKIPFVLTYHAGGFYKGQLLADLVTSLYAATLEKVMLRHANRIIVLNEFVRDTTMKAYRSKVVLIRPGVTLPKTSSHPKKKKAANHLLFVGNLDKSHSWKGVETLLKAMVWVGRKQPNAILDIVGGGDNLSYYQGMIKQLGLDNVVIFHGKVPNSRVAQYYQATELLVLPSYTEAESLGLVILEAMTFGVPIVASKVGGIPYSVKDNFNGLLVKPKDDVALARAITRVLSDPKTQQRFSKNSQKLSRLYNWQSHVKSLTQEFMKIRNEK